MAVAVGPDRDDRDLRAQRVEPRGTRATPGRAAIQPARRIRRRPQRSAITPANPLAKAFTTPKDRSIPTIAPTKALMRSRSENCPRFSLSPRRIAWGRDASGLWSSGPHGTRAPNHRRGPEPMAVTDAMAPLHYEIAHRLAPASRSVRSPTGNSPASLLATIRLWFGGVGGSLRRIRSAKVAASAGS